MTSMEYRQHTRHGNMLRLRLQSRLGEVETRTTEISRRGVSAPMVMPPAMGERLRFILDLPDLRQLTGTALCRNERPDGNVGFSIEFNSAEDDQRYADFLAMEETTGSLWRMLDRYREAGIDDGQIAAIFTQGEVDKLVDGSAQVQLLERSGGLDSAGDIRVRLHSTGENSAAYQLLFAKHPHQAPEHSEVFFRFPECQRIWHQIERILEQKVLLRLNRQTPIISVQICELKRGGFAYLKNDAQKNCSLVSLGFGELMVIEVDGESLFPYLSDVELEQIACDTIRHDLSQPVFRSLQAKSLHDNVLAAQPKSESQRRRMHDLQGLAALRQSVLEAQIVQTRVYGERAMRLFPELWARLPTEQGELMGPTLEDREHLCLLALVGPGSPRVVRLHQDSPVKLMQKP